MQDYRTCFDECKELFQKKLRKNFSDFTTQEKVILTDIVCDKIVGRMSLFLRWNTAERTGFLMWLKELGVEYSELPDGERWAYEDAYSILEDVTHT